VEIVEREQLDLNRRADLGRRTRAGGEQREQCDCELNCQVKLLRSAIFLLRALYCRPVCLPAFEPPRASSASFAPVIKEITMPRINPITAKSDLPASTTPPPMRW